MLVFRNLQDCHITLLISPRYPKKLEDAAKRIDRRFVPELHSLIQKGPLGRFERYPLTELARKDFSSQRLFDFGVQHLPSNDNRPDEALASYFLILSAITSLPSNKRDFAMNAMAYCKNESDTPTGSAEELRAAYMQLERTKFFPTKCC